MNRIVKLLALVLSVCLMLSLAACGGETQPTSEPTTEPTQAPTTQPTEAVDPGVNEFVFEAEYVDLTYLSGHGWSNEVLGTGLLVKDEYGAGASNGYALGYLYENGNEIEFYIYSDKAVEDVTLVLRCTMEHKVSSASIAWEEFEITVNDGDPIQYRTMTFNNIPGLMTVKNQLLGFSNKTIGKIDLQEGENLIKLEVTNNITMEGTMQATAPIIDCIILRTEDDVEITWASGFPMNTDFIEAN